MPSRQAILVTGGNRGLGLETCRQLAAQGERVLLTARDEKSGRDAARGLDPTGSKVEFVALDVANPSSLEALVKELSNRGESLVGLVNNAAVAHKGFNAEIVRDTMAVNFYGPLRLTQSLLPLLVPTARVVMVSSGMGSREAFSSAVVARFEPFQHTIATLCATVDRYVDSVRRGVHEREGWSGSEYGMSKLALNTLTQILAREDPMRRINAVCPGWVKTRMGGAGAPKEIVDGARGIVWAATLDQHGPTGGFFRDGRAIEW